MGLDKELLKGLLDLFRAELTDKIQAITDRLLILEKGARGKKRQETLDDIFRDAHSIKGAAHAVAVADVGDIAHHMESLFSKLRQGGRKPAHELIDVCLESLDRMQQAMEAFDEKRPLDFDLAALLGRMDEQLKAMGAGGKVHSTGKVKKEDVPAKNGSATTNGSQTAPADDFESEPGSQAKSGLIRISMDKLQSISAQAEELQTAKIEMTDHLRVVGRLRDKLQSFALEWKRSAPNKRRNQNGAATTAPGSGDSRSDTLAELSAAASSLYSEMRSSTSQLSLLAEALQDQVQLIRLVPVSTILNPLRRTVRDIAREMNKTIQLETTGDDIEMDRQLLDKLRDPLIHLLRNACDHGIEAPDARRELGKPAAGSLTVAVGRQGNQIIITVEDDGAGISVDDVLRTARRKKLLRGLETESVAPEDILDLIFRPGYSSKEIITNVSGRGIGLDLVRTNLRSIKGSVDVNTTEGEGTAFTLRVPLTVATDHGLIVRAGGAVYAIPSTSVDRVLEIEREDIVDIEASQAILVAKRTIPLRALSDVLDAQMENRDFNGRLPVVVVSRSWDAVAFLVDEVIGEREIVVKRFQPPLVSIRNVAGGTLTGSGEIIPVLNPSDLVASGLRRGVRSRIVATGEDVEEEIQPRILVVDDSITTRTLEKNILENFGYTVEVAVDGNEAWEQLQSQPFDLVVTDIEMPELDGFELTERIKQSTQFANLPVVIVTSLAKETDKQRGIEVGADAYIVKQQFETRALLDVIGQFV